MQLLEVAINSSDFTIRHDSFFTWMIVQLYRNTFQKENLYLITNTSLKIRVYSSYYNIRVRYRNNTE